LTFFAFARYFKHQAFWGFLMRCIATLFLAGSVIVSSSAFAGEGALKSGLPAGVHRAQAMDNGSTVLLAVGAMVAAASIALLISSTSGNGAPAATAAAAGGTTTTSTSTSTTS
jgi:hypothetical protein